MRRWFSVIGTVLTVTGVTVLALTVNLEASQYIAMLLIMVGGIFTGASINRDR